MEVQPSLVLLQKTLLNIEGLGRQLYPQLDLWTTAKPFLENWLRERMHPKTLLDDLRRYGPEWLEKFPQVPDLLFDAAQQIRQLDQQLLAIRQQQELHPSRHPAGHSRPLLGVAALFGALTLAAPQWLGSLAQMPPASWLLAGLGLYWLCRR
jgi:ubiquinone biosynthesis protein